MIRTLPFPSLRVSAAKSPITLDHQALKFSIRAVPLILAVVLVAIASGPTASAQAVSYAGSGAVNFGTANVCPSGKTAPAPCSQTLALTYNVTESGTLGTPLALTTGAPNLDYKLASGGTCAGSVVKGNTCKVNVTFAPIAPGARNGAVEIVDSSGNALATTYIYGSGVGPLIGYTSASLAPQTVGPVGPINSPGYAVAVDASGDVFVSYPGYYIQELLAVGGKLPANPVVNTINTAGYYSGLLAIDGAGNLFSALSPDPRNVIEILAAGGYSTIKPVGDGFTFPSGIAVDGSGNLFICDQGDYPVIPPSVREFLAAGGYATGKALGNGYNFFNPQGLAVDGSGNVFVIDDDGTSSLVEEILATSDYNTVRVLNLPTETGTLKSIAVDPAGNLFAESSGGLVELLAVGGVVPSIPTILALDPFAFGNITGGNTIAIDGSGNIYAEIEVADGDEYFFGQVAELQLATPPPLAFASTDVGYTSPDSPQSIEIQNHGNAALDVTSISVAGPNWSKASGSGTPPDCASSFSLVPSGLCNLGISFKPTETGPLTSAVTVVDNTLNAPGSSQSGSLSGTASSGALPILTGLSTTYGAPSAVLTLTGTNFGASQGSSTVTLNTGNFNEDAPVISWSNTSITVTVPNFAVPPPVAIVVTVGGQVSNPVLFTIEASPTIYGITANGAGGLVTIDGANLLDYGNQATVTFNGKSLPVLGDSNDSIEVAAPAGPATGEFQVVVNHVAVNSSAFTVPASPIVFPGPASASFGAVNVCPSGKTVPAPCSKSVKLTYTVSVDTTLAAPRALTTGQPGLDYTIAGGSTCVGKVSAGTACTVNVAFAPISPGARNGAVEVVDANGDLVATTYLAGNGVGPLASFGPPAQLTLAAGFYSSGIAVDASGDLFLDESNSGITELLAVNGSIPPNPVAKTLYKKFIAGLALDGAGNFFFGDNGGHVMEALAATDYAQTRTVGTGLTDPYVAAVDGSGNVFVIDQITYNPNYPPNYFVKEILAAGGYTTTNTLGGGFLFTNPVSMAVDGSGNLFVGNTTTNNDQTTYFNNPNTLDELTPADNYSTVKTIPLPGSGYTYPVAVAVDPAGNLFVAIYLPSGGQAITYVWEFFAVNGVLPPNPVATLVSDNYQFLSGMALDRHGNLLTVDNNDEGLVQELQLSAPPPLAFSTVGVGYASGDSPQTLQIQNQGNADLELTSLAVSANWEQVTGSGTPPDCSTGFSLVAGAACDLNISFKPAKTGALAGAVTVVDNTLNLPGSTQSGALHGTGISGPPTPHIASLNTTYGAPYSVVILNGINFGATQGSSTVTFNGIPTPHYSWSDTKIYVTVPPNAATGDVVVNVAKEPSNAVPFTVVPQPSISSIYPTSGPPGTLVYINGQNLAGANNPGAVTFNGKPLPIYAYAFTDSDSNIEVVVPPAAVTGVFHVVINDSGMNSPTFTVTH